MPETLPPEIDTTVSERILLVNGQQFLTDLPENVAPFGDDTVDVTTDSLKPRDLDCLEARAYAIYFSGEDQVEPLVVARSIIMRLGPKGMVVDSECFAPNFGNNDSGNVTYISGGEGYLKALGYEFSSDETGLYISGIPTPETIQSAAAEQGIEVKFFEEKEIRSPEYLETIAEGKYPISYGYFDHDIGDDHITAFLLGGAPMKNSLRRIAQDALLLSRNEQDVLTANIDYFTNLYRSVISEGVENHLGGGKTGRQWLFESGKDLGLTESEIEDILQTGLSRAKDFAT